MTSERLCRHVAWLAALVLMVGVVLGWSRPSLADEDANAVQQAKGLSRAFRAAAKSVLPTVVMVKTSTKPRESRGPLGPRAPFPRSPLGELFRDDSRGMQRMPQPGLGSGVIIDPSGIILTNNHVIEDADEVIIQLADGREFTVTSTHVDAATDLAMMRIETDESLPAAKLGDSD